MAKVGVERRRASTSQRKQELQKDAKLTVWETKRPTNCAELGDDEYILKIICNVVYRLL